MPTLSKREFIKKAQEIYSSMEYHRLPEPLAGPTHLASNVLSTLTAGYLGQPSKLAYFTQLLSKKDEELTAEVARLLTEDEVIKKSKSLRNILTIVNHYNHLTDEQQTVTETENALRVQVQTSEKDETPNQPPKTLEQTFHLQFAAVPEANRLLFLNHFDPLMNTRLVSEKASALASALKSNEDALLQANAKALTELLAIEKKFADKLEEKTREFEDSSQQLVEQYLQLQEKADADVISSASTTNDLQAEIENYRNAITSLREELEDQEVIKNQLQFAAETLREQLGQLQRKLNCSMQRERILEGEVNVRTKIATGKEAALEFALKQLEELQEKINALEMDSDYVINQNEDLEKAYLTQETKLRDQKLHLELQAYHLKKMEAARAAQPDLANQLKAAKALNENLDTAYRTTLLQLNSANGNAREKEAINRQLRRELATLKNAQHAVMFKTAETHQQKKQQQKQQKQAIKTAGMRQG